MDVKKLFEGEILGQKQLTARVRSFDSKVK